MRIGLREGGVLYVKLHELLHGRLGCCSILVEEEHKRGVAAVVEAVEVLDSLEGLGIVGVVW